VKLTLTQEQSMLADSVTRFMAGKNTPGEEESIWREVAELGWLGAGVGESAGGFGGGREMAIVMEGVGGSELAQALAPVFVALAILEKSDPEAALISGIISGDVVACGLLPEMAADDGLKLEDELTSVSGQFHALANVHRARHLVLALPEATLLLPASDPNVHLRSYRGMDGKTKSDLKLDHVALSEASVLSKGPDAAAALHRARVTHAAAITAECSGLAAALFQYTLDYVKQRRQFGQPIGRFQALQHRLVDMFVAVEEVQSLALAAARAATIVDVPESALSRAITGASDRALHVAKEAIQLHGAVAMTEDLPLGAGLRRLKVLQLMPGGAETHRRRLQQSFN